MTKKAAKRVKKTAAPRARRPPLSARPKAPALVTAEKAAGLVAAKGGARPQPPRRQKRTTTKQAPIKGKAKAARNKQILCEDDNKKSKGKSVARKSTPAMPELELPPLEAPELEPRPVGRPSLYSAELAETICMRIAGGESLRSICRDVAMPEMGTVLRWRLSNKEFSEQYAQAREIQAEGFYDELLEIADDSENDWITIIDKDGNEKRIPNDQLVNRSRLRVDTRKWAMSRILVKRYGNKVEAQVTGKDGGPVIFKLKRVDQE